MKKRHPIRLSALLALSFIAACSQSSATFDIAAHQQEVMEWRDWRMANLKDPAGYLNQIGLYWLEPGVYSFGSDASNDVVFDVGTAAIGTFTVSESGVSMSVADGVEVMADGVSVKEIEIPSDISGNGIMVTHETLGWTVVDRVGRFAVRLRDFEHPFVETFGPLPYYQIDPNLRVEATLHRYDEPRIASVETVIDGLDYRPEVPGVVRFEIDGQSFELEAYTSGEQLFYVFGDQTNRDETYGAGRFLYSAMPDENGVTVLDFNKSYSPPCAFNDFSTCPIASPRNRLAVRVEAGEKFDEQFHYSPTHYSATP